MIFNVHAAGFETNSYVLFQRITFYFFNFSTSCIFLFLIFIYLYVSPSYLVMLYKELFPKVVSMDYYINKSDVKKKNREKIYGQKGVIWIIKQVREGFKYQVSLTC